MRDRNLYVGETVSWPATWLWRDGSPVDFTVPGRRGELLICMTPPLLLSTDDPTQWTWTAQADGEGIWTLDSDTALLLIPGVALAVTSFFDGSVSPEGKYVVGHADYAISEAPCGVLV